MEEERQSLDLHRLNLNPVQPQIVSMLLSLFICFLNVYLEDK